MIILRPTGSNTLAGTSTMLFYAIWDHPDYWLTSSERNMEAIVSYKLTRTNEHHTMSAGLPQITP